MKMTRRKLAAAVLGSTAAAVAQTQPPAADPQDEMAVARTRLRTSLNTVAALTVPMDVEPAFEFKA